MKEIKLTGYPTDWSRTGEHNAVALLVDATQFTALWPNGLPQTAYRRPDGTTYPVPCDLADGLVRVVLTSTETAVAGMASLEVQWLDGGTVAKSVTYNGRILQALDAGGAPPDPPGTGWLDEVRAVGVGVELDRIAVTGMRGEVETLTGQVRNDAQGVAADRDATHGYMERAETAAEGAEGSEISAGQSSGIAAQALADLLRMLGTDIATLIGGKIPVDQIPLSIAHHVEEIESVDQLTTLTLEQVQINDVAAIIEGTGDSKRRVKAYQLLGTGDPSIRANWVEVATDFASQSAYAVTAGEAENATKINGKRLIAMTQAQYDIAVKDPDTLYAVTPEEG